MVKFHARIADNLGVVSVNIFNLIKVACTEGHKGFCNFRNVPVFNYFFAFDMVCEFWEILDFFGGFDFDFIRLSPILKNKVLFLGR